MATLFSLWLGFAFLFALLFCLPLCEVTAPFFWGGVLAYMLHPLVLRLTRWVPKTSAISCVLIVILGVIFLAFQWLLPLIVIETFKLIREIPYLAVHWNLNDHRGLWELIQKTLASLDLQSWNYQALHSFTSHTMPLISKIISGGQTIFSSFFKIFIVIFSCFYALHDGQRALRALQALIPHPWMKTLEFYGAEVHRLLICFMRGQLSVCLVSSAMHATGLWFFGLNGGVLIGLASGLLAFIPYAGLTLGLVTSCSLGFLQFDSFYMVGGIVIFFLVVHFIEANILIPQWVGSKIGLHPVGVIFVLWVVLELFGFWGLLWGLPLCIILKVFIDISIDFYKKSFFYRKFCNKQS